MYNQIDVDCDVCGCRVKNNKWARHLRTEKHRKGVEGGRRWWTSWWGYVEGKGWAELSTMPCHYWLILLRYYTHSHSLFLFLCQKQSSLPETSEIVWAADCFIVLSACGNWWTRFWSRSWNHLVLRGFGWEGHKSTSFPETFMSIIIGDRYLF